MYKVMWHHQHRWFLLNQLFYYWPLIFNYVKGVRGATQLKDNSLIKVLINPNHSSKKL